LQTNALDEAIALPTDFSARIARNTQLYLQKETDICRVVDPWGGSDYIESLTDEIAQQAWEHILEVEEMGGMVKAIEAGIPKMRIEEAAARKQARIDSGMDIIVGVNAFRVENTPVFDILEVDNSAVRDKQVARLKEIRSRRDNAAVEKALQALTEAAAHHTGNLLELSVQAARLRATLGEISYALEKVYGRYKAVIRSVGGVYATTIAMDETFNRARKMADEFAALDGRRPRILVAKLGQDGHDRGAKVIATGFADIGFDVDIGPLFQTPAEAARQAAENDVHVIGISSLAAGHKTLIPMLIDALKAIGRPDIMVICGGVIPEQDHAFLFESGVVGIYGPGTKLADAAKDILSVLLAAKAKKAGN
jgi:methylmalonyl-CoA mutase